MHPSRSVVFPLSAWEFLEVPREDKSERPYRAVISVLEDITHVGESALDVDYYAMLTGIKSRLILDQAVLRQVSFKKAKELGIIAGMDVI